MQLDFGRQHGPLSYDPDSRLFSADMSDIAPRDIPRRIKIKVLRSGNVRTFNLRETCRDAERDITCWNYVDPIGNFRLTVFND